MTVREGVKEKRRGADQGVHLKKLVRVREVVILSRLRRRKGKPERAYARPG